MPPEPSRSVQLADTVSALLYGIAGWLLVGFGAFGILVTVLRVVGNPASTNIVASLVVVFLSALFVVAGVFVNPRFRRRLDRRHSVTRFGRARSVDERVLRASEGRTERCVTCGTRLHEGLVRRYRDEFCVAGIPVVTLSEGRNFYCVDCTTVEVTGDVASDAVVAEVDVDSPPKSLTEADQH